MAPIKKKTTAKKSPAAKATKPAPKKAAKKVAAKAAKPAAKKPVKPAKKAAAPKTKKQIPASAPIMDAGAVLNFLKSTPDFLHHHPYAMDYLVPPKVLTESGKNVRDFMSFMVEKLKADKDRVVTTARALVENARSNMDNQSRIEGAILRLLEARSFDEFIDTITLELAGMLDTDICVLVIESDTGSIPHVHTNGVRLIPPGTVNKWLGAQDSLLQSNISGIEVIYGGAYALVQSQALIRVDRGMDIPPCILAFGSRHPDTFHEGQGTEQINFLARVVERLVKSWLNRPE